MDYLTKYYKNLAEDLSRRLNHLQILVEASKLEDDEMVDPETGMPLMPLSSKFARSPYTPTESDKLVSNAFSVPGSFQAPTPLSPRPQLGRVDFSSQVSANAEKDIQTSTDDDEDVRSNIEMDVMQSNDDIPENERRTSPFTGRKIERRRTFLTRDANVANQIEREREERHPEAAQEKQNIEDTMKRLGMISIKNNWLDSKLPFYNNMLNYYYNKQMEKLYKNPTASILYKSPKDQETYGIK